MSNVNNLAANDFIGHRTAEQTPPPYRDEGRRASMVSKHLGPVAVHWFAEVANSPEGEAVLEVNATAAFDRRLSDYDDHMTAVFTAMRDNPDSKAAFLAKLRQRVHEGDLPPDSPVEYDVRENQIGPRAQAAIEQIEQGEQ